MTFRPGTCSLAMTSVDQSSRRHRLIDRKLGRLRTFDQRQPDLAIRFAHARGLSERAILFRHALKNTLVPVITITGLQLGSLIAFAIITESVFQWPGMGLLFINAIQFVDIPVMASYLMVISVMFVAINLIVDLLYVAIDPRLRS